MSEELFQIWRKCHLCGGQGTIPWQGGGQTGGNVTCTECGGTGRWPGTLVDHGEIVSKCVDVFDKCNDILDKCNDIFEKVSE